MFGISSLPWLAYHYHGLYIISMVGISFPWLVYHYHGWYIITMAGMSFPRLVYHFHGWYIISMVYHFRGWYIISMAICKFHVLYNISVFGVYSIFPWLSFAFPWLIASMESVITSIDSYHGFVRCQPGQQCSLTSVKNVLLLVGKYCQYIYGIWQNKNPSFSEGLLTFSQVC